MRIPHQAIAMAHHGMQYPSCCRTGQNTRGAGQILEDRVVFGDRHSTESPWFEPFLQPIPPIICIAFAEMRHLVKRQLENRGDTRPETVAFSFSELTLLDGFHYVRIPEMRRSKYMAFLTTQ